MHENHILRLRRSATLHRQAASRLEDSARYWNQRDPGRAVRARWDAALERRAARLELGESDYLAALDGFGD
jgi:hypothetical protein